MVQRYTFGVFRRTLRAVCAVAGCIAVGIAAFVPLHTDQESLIFLGSILAGVACLIAWSALDEEPGDSKLWPPSKKTK